MHEKKRSANAFGSSSNFALSHRAKRVIWQVLTIAMMEQGCLCSLLLTKTFSKRRLSWVGNQLICMILFILKCDRNILCNGLLVSTGNVQTKDAQIKHRVYLYTSHDQRI